MKELVEVVSSCHDCPPSSRWWRVFTNKKPLNGEINESDARACKRRRGGTQTGTERTPAWVSVWMNHALSGTLLPADTKTLKCVCGDDEIPRRRQGFPRPRLRPREWRRGEGGRLRVSKGVGSVSSLSSPPRRLYTLHTSTHTKKASKIQSSSRLKYTSKGQVGGARQAASVKTF